MNEISDAFTPNFDFAGSWGMALFVADLVVLLLGVLVLLGVAAWQWWSRKKLNLKAVR